MGTHRGREGGGPLRTKQRTLASVTLQNSQGPAAGRGGAWARGEAEPQEALGSARWGIKSSPHPTARQCQQRWPQTEARPRSQGVPTPG